MAYSTTVPATIVSQGWPRSIIAAHLHRSLACAQGESLWLLEPPVKTLCIQAWLRFLVRLGQILGRIPAFLSIRPCTTAMHLPVEGARVPPLQCLQTILCCSIFGPLLGDALAGSAMVWKSIDVNHTCITTGKAGAGVVGTDSTFSVQTVRVGEQRKGLTWHSCSNCAWSILCDLD